MSRPIVLTQLGAVGPQPRPLPSGRSVLLRIDEGHEELEVRSPEGAVELTVLLTAGGPVVRLRGARLELEALDDIALRCRRLEVSASEGTHLHSGGEVRITGQEMRARAQGDIHMDGDIIRLNCEKAAPPT
jgi:hypothetical protein